MFRTEEERRKLENRAAATEAAVEELRDNPGFEDATAEIEDDWLNLFTRLSEDKSSDELRRLFGKVLAGEIKRPGSFSLRTIQLLATISKHEANLVPRFLSYALDGLAVPFIDSVKPDISDGHRLLVQQIGIACHPTQTGSMALRVEIGARNTQLIHAAGLGIFIQNDTEASVKFVLVGQMVTMAGQELIPIANLEPPRLEYIKDIAHNVYRQIRGDPNRAAQMDAGLIKVAVVRKTIVGGIARREVIQVVES